MAPPARLLIALLAGGLLGSCSALDPYPTAPRPAPTTVSVPPGRPGVKLQSMPPAASRVGICYNTITTTLAQVREQAQGECPANTVAEPVDTDWYMQNCPLLLPARGTFVCTPRK